MALSLYDVKSLIRPDRYNETPSDDFRIINSWVEYEDKYDKDFKDRPLKYLCYEFEAMNPETGERKRLYKAIKFVRVIRLPKDSKQSTSFMDKHEQVLAAVYESEINLLTVIANVMKPTAIGLLYLYGVQAVAQDIDAAKEKCQADFMGFTSSMQGTYRVLEMRVINAQETEWLKEKMHEMTYITSVRGIPYASKAGEDAGNKGYGGKNMNPDSQGTLEEIIMGMADHEYIIQVLSTPVRASTLQAWLTRNERQMTGWYNQLQGNTGLSFNLSIPMMYGANNGSNSGWSHGYSDADSVSYSDNQSYSQSNGENWGNNISHSVSENLSQSISNSLTNSFSSSQSYGQNLSYSEGQNLSYSQGENLSYSQGQSIGESFGENYGDSLNISQGTSHNTGVSQGESLNLNHGQNIGESFGESTSSSYGMSSSESTSSSHGLSESFSSGTSHSQGISESFSENQSTGYSQSSSESTGHSSGTSNGVSLGQNYSTSHSVGESFGQGSSSGWSNSSSSNGGMSTSSSESAGISLGETDGSVTNSGGSLSAFGAGINLGGSSSNGTSASENYSNSLSNGYNYSNGISSSLSGGSSTNYGQSLSNGTSEGASYGSSQSLSESDSYTYGQSYGTTSSFGQGHSVGSSESYGTSTSNSIGENYSVSNGQSLGESWGTSMGTSNSVSIGESLSQGYGYSIGSSESAGTSQGLSQGQSHGTSYGTNQGVSQSISQGVSQSISQGVSQSVSQGTSQSISQGTSQSIGQSVGVSKGTGTSDSTGQSYGQSQSVSSSNGYGHSTGNSRSNSLGSSGGVSTGMSASMGFSPSIGYNKSHQWLDQEVKDLIEMFEFENERLKRSLRGNGAFYTYVYIACPNKDALAAAMTTAKSTWHNENAMVSPLQVLELSLEEQKHLLYHFAAFSSDVTKEDVYGIKQYKYCTVLLNDEYVAYSHLPRVSEGGVFSEVNDIPKFAYPSMMKGEIYIGNIISAERWTMQHGYNTPSDYRLDESELMHGIITAGSRVGKTVLAMRLIAELANTRRKSTGKRLRIVCMDPKQDWRTIANFVEPERFRFYSLGNVNFHPLKLNPWKIPHGVWPQMWIDGVIDIYCRAYGLLERGKQMIGEVVYELYDKAGVFDACDTENWKDVVPGLSAQVSFEAIYRLMESKRDALAMAKKVGFDTMDAYARLLERLQCFSRKYSIERRLFGTSEGMGIDEMIGNDDVTVLESKGLEKTFNNFIFGVITSGFYKYAMGQEKGFLSDDQYETVLVIEEANQVLTGDTSGKGDMQLAGQSEFEQILDQAAGYGLFVFAITQQVSLMPKSIVANAGLKFVGRLGADEDIKAACIMLGKEPVRTDIDVYKWIPKSPVGNFICQSTRGYDYKAMDPVLVQVAPLNTPAPSNQELDDILIQKQIRKLIKDNEGDAGQEAAVTA